MAVGYFDGTDQPAPLYDLGWEAPAGQMYAPSLEREASGMQEISCFTCARVRYSTVEDLCHLMSLIFRDNYTEYTIPSQILDGQTIKEWLIPLYDSAAAKYGVRTAMTPHTVVVAYTEMNLLLSAYLHGHALGESTLDLSRKPKLLAKGKGTARPHPSLLNDGRRVTRVNVNQSGAVFGYTAEIMMIPELKLGVAVLMNGTHWDPLHCPSGCTSP
jgi:hypothetical protein